MNAKVVNMVEERLRLLSLPIVHLLLLVSVEASLSRLREKPSIFCTFGVSEICQGMVFVSGIPALGNISFHNRGNITSSVLNKAARSEAPRARPRPSMQWQKGASVNDVRPEG